MLPAVGFDVEWEVWTFGARPIATVQLATAVGTAFIFHVKCGPGGRKKAFPEALRAVLERQDILKVGVGVNSAFGVKAKAGMDLAVASRRYLSRSLLGTISLSSLCSELLQRDLPKPQSLRMSAWEGELSARQINYAGLDALAAIVLYNFIMGNADPIHFRTPPEDSDLAPGTSVRLYTKNSFSFVAEGNVVETPRGGRSASRMLSPRATRRVKVSLAAVLARGLGLEALETVQVLANKSQGPMHQSTTTRLGEGMGLQRAIMEREGGLLPLATAASVSARESTSGQ